MANAFLELGYPTASLASFYAVALTPGGGQAWNGSALETTDGSRWSTYAIALADAAGIGVYSAAVPPGLPPGNYSFYAFGKVGSSPAPGDTKLTPGDSYYWDGRSLTASASITTIDGVMRAASSGGNLSFDTRDAYANGLPNGAVNQYVLVSGGTGQGQLIPVASISGASGAKVGTIAAGYTLLTPLGTDSQYYWPGLATTTTASGGGGTDFTQSGVIEPGETGIQTLRLIRSEAVGKWDPTAAPGYGVFYRKDGATEAFRSPIPGPSGRGNSSNGGGL